MKIIRTVIVDDSAFVRKVVREMLSTSPQIEVVGTARNGHDALEMVASLQPDVVTCDLTMPELDGVEFVRCQMARKPVPILILTASPQDAEKVLLALEAGAVDFIRKPTALAHEDLFHIRQELIEKIKLAAGCPTRVLPPAHFAAEKLPSPRVPRTGSFDIIVLGISTGGPQALRYLIPQLSADLPVPLVMVLHMPVGYTAIFAEKLAEISALPVTEATEGVRVQAPQALLAPAGHHLSFRRNSNGETVVALSLQPEDKPHRPSVDVLFQSAAEVYQERVLGIIMTGMGTDGRDGAGCVKAAGGMILTQSPESCIIYGMPRAVVEAGFSDGTVTLEYLAKEIAERL